MKTVLKWIVLVWSVIGVIYNLTDTSLSLEVALYSLLYSGLIIGIMISDLKEGK